MKITSVRVAMYTTALCGIVAAILILYSTLGNPHVEYKYVPQITGSYLIKPACVASASAFDAILYALEGIALLSAAYLCYVTKDALDAVNESHSIAMAVLIIIFIASHTPIILFLPVDPYVNEVIVSCCFFLALNGALTAYFGQKVYYLVIGADLNTQFKIVFKDGSRPAESDKGEALRRSSEHEINVGVHVPDDVKTHFYEHEVPDEVRSQCGVG